MTIQMKEIHLHKTETYQIGYDDHCVVIARGASSIAPKIWLSKSMLAFLEKHKFSEVATKQEMRLKLKGAEK